MTLKCVIIKRMIFVRVIAYSDNFPLTFNCSCTILCYVKKLYCEQLWDSSSKVQWQLCLINKIYLIFYIDNALPSNELWDIFVEVVLIIHIFKFHAELNFHSMNESYSISIHKQVKINIFFLLEKIFGNW